MSKMFFWLENAKKTIVTISCLVFAQTFISFPLTLPLLKVFKNIIMPRRRKWKNRSEKNRAYYQKKKRERERERERCLELEQQRSNQAVNQS